MADYKNVSCYFILACKLVFTSPVRPSLEYPVILSYLLQQWCSGHKNFAVIHSLRSKTETHMCFTAVNKLSLSPQPMRNSTCAPSSPHLVEGAFAVFPLTVGWVWVAGWTDSVRALSSMSLSWSWTCSRTFTFTFCRQTHRRKYSLILHLDSIEGWWY